MSTHYLLYRESSRKEPFTTPPGSPSHCKPILSLDTPVTTTSSLSEHDSIESSHVLDGEFVSEFASEFASLYVAQDDGESIGASSSDENDGHSEEEYIGLVKSSSNEGEAEGEEGDADAEEEDDANFTLHLDKEAWCSNHRPPEEEEEAPSPPSSPRPDWTWLHDQVSKNGTGQVPTEYKPDWSWLTGNNENQAEDSTKQLLALLPEPPLVKEDNSTQEVPSLSGDSVQADWWLEDVAIVKEYHDRQAQEEAKGDNASQKKDGRLKLNHRVSDWSDPYGDDSSAGDVSFQDNDDSKYGLDDSSVSLKERFSLVW